MVTNDGVNSLGMNNSIAGIAWKHLHNSPILHITILKSVTTRLFRKRFAIRESVNFRTIQDHQVVMAKPTDFPERSPA